MNFMCCGGIYLDITTNKLIKVFFPIPNILIPVVDLNGTYELCQWGQRESDKNLIKELPITGWARLESLDKLYWTRHNLQKVLIPFKSFFEKDKNDPSYPKNKATEFELQKEQALLGVLIENPIRNVVYVVTEPIKNWIHDRHPLIVKINQDPQTRDSKLDSDYNPCNQNVTIHAGGQ